MIIDREGDFSLLYYAQTQQLGVDLLIRAKSNRLIKNSKKSLFKYGRSLKTSGKMEVKVGRQSERPKLSGKQAKLGHPERTAELNVTFGRVEFGAPKHVTNKDNLQLTLITCVETKDPKTDDKVEWYLLTTKNITTFEDACHCVKLYAKRWIIEQYHNVLKSGCNSKNLQHRTVKAIERHIIINGIIAWRIMLITLAGRNVKYCMPEALFTEVQLVFLDIIAKKNGKKIENLHDAIEVMQTMGGYSINNKKEVAGHRVTGKAYERLNNGINCIEIFLDAVFTPEMKAMILKYAKIGEKMAIHNIFLQRL